MVSDLDPAAIGLKGQSCVAPRIILFARGLAGALSASWHHRRHADRIGWRSHKQSNDACSDVAAGGQARDSAVDQVVASGTDGDALEAFGTRHLVAEERTGSTKPRGRANLRAATCRTR